MVGFDDAFALSESLLARALPDRWRHVQSVAHQASRIGAVADVDDEDLRLAAILHDIGYAPEIAHMRFHPLDGARFLYAEGYPERVVSLVARHSCAVIEAELRGTNGVEDYVDESTPTRDALWRASTRQRARKASGSPPTIGGPRSGPATGPTASSRRFSTAPSPRCALPSTAP